MASDNREFVPIGTIETNAPHAALLSSLNAMRPQWQIRLTQVTEDSLTHRYRVDLHRDKEESVQDAGPIDVWMRVKSALMSAFPADKPNSVTAIDP